MKIVFFGTPEYVMPILTSLHKKFVTGPGKSPIVAVVTQGPKPVGRKEIVTFSPVDKWAHEHKIFTYYSAADLIKANLDLEIGVLASYGEIIPQEVINLFPKGILVIHPSLLPKYRGASPIQSAIAAGDTITGSTIFKMDAKMDHVRARLFDRSVDVLLELIEPYLQGKIKLKKQNDEEATFTKMVKRENGLVDLKRDDPKEIERKLRAFYPWPGIYTLLPDGKRLKILKVHFEDEKLVLDEVQLEAKNPVTWKQFKEAHPQIEF